MKNLLILLALFCGSWFASAQQEQFIVYDISAKVDGVGIAYASDDFADGGETHNSWKGKLLYDAGSGLAAIVWRTKLNREKVQELVSFDLSVLGYDVHTQSAQPRNVFALAASTDLANFPDQDSASFVVLLGDLAKDVTINTDPNGPVSKLVSARLSGRLWFLYQGPASYRFAKITARFSLKDSRFANEQLGDYNGDGFIDLDDVIDYWQEFYRPDWQPIND
jgi:hypothetical protein